ncbi:glycosyltransferase, partial [Patescibacteria group bacterium]|nr:glycosyltransferase [Patescibacteria group bacterium]
KNVLPRSKKDFPEVSLLDDDNIGFAGNNNQGIKIALNKGYDYIFLHNGDLKLEPTTIEELVALAESDSSVGSVQALVKHWNSPKLVNVSGGVFHISGYAYAKDNGKKISEMKYIMDRR